jgi:hypothetical protein
LKAVVASQDLGAAGTEFERSLIVLPFNKNYRFLRPFSAPLSLLFRRQSSCLFLPYYSPILSFFLNTKEASWVRFLLRPMLFQIGVFGGMRNQIQ